MNICELVSALLTSYESEFKHVLYSRDKYPQFTIEYQLCSLAEFIDKFTEQGIFIMQNPMSAFQCIFQSILISQTILSSISSNTFTLSVQASPYFFSKINKVFAFSSKIVTLSSVYVKSLSCTSSFVSGAEYICRTCCESFTVFNDLTSNNTIQSPFKCQAFSLSEVPKTKEYRFDLSCEGNGFDLLEGSLVYSDYQELVVSDGKNELLVIIQGGLCNTAKIGECIEITGIYTQR